MLLHFPDGDTEFKVKWCALRQTVSADFRPSSRNLWHALYSEPSRIVAPTIFTITKVHFKTENHISGHYKYWNELFRKMNTEGKKATLICPLFKRQIFFLVNCYITNFLFFSPILEVLENATCHLNSLRFYPKQ